MKIVQVNSKKELGAFIDFPHDLYKDDPNYVPELFIAQRDLLTKHPFHKHNQLQCFLAYDGDLLVGVGGLNIQQRPGSFRVPDGKSGYIMNMYTKPAYRKRGIATKLLDKLIQKGREMGLVYFDLNATKEGEPVYLKYGFTRHDEPNYRKVFL